MNTHTISEVLDDPEPLRVELTEKCIAPENRALYGNVATRFRPHPRNSTDFYERPYARQKWRFQIHHAEIKQRSNTRSATAERQRTSPAKVPRRRSFDNVFDCCLENRVSQREMNWIKSTGSRDESTKPTLEVANSNDKVSSVLSVLANILMEHNYSDMRDITSLQRTCRLFHGVMHSPYFYTRVLRAIYRVPFEINPLVGPARSVRRWVKLNFEWLPLKDESNVWLSRAVDPNPIGCHDSPVYVFGGQSVHESRYSNTLLKLTFRGHQLIKEEIAAEGIPPCARAACGLAAMPTLGGERLFMFGGRGSGWYLDDLWTWEDSRWVQIPRSEDSPWPAKRWAHSMVSVPGGFLLYGGSAPGVLFDDLWSFRPEEGWKCVQCPGTLPPSRAGQACLLHEGTLYISGGNTAGPIVDTYRDVWRLKFDFSADGHPRPIGSWDELNICGPALTARIGHSITPLSDNRILLFGGRNLSYGVKEEDQFATDADVIDVETCTNNPVQMPSWLQRTGACAMNHPEGVVFWGGLASDRVSSTTASVAPAVLFRPI